MLITALEKEKQQIYHNGHLEGKREGHFEGKIEAAQAMFAKGMEIELIAEITNLPEAQLKTLLSIKGKLYQ